MSSKQLALLVLLVLLSPVETYILAMMVPFLLVGGFSLAASVLVMVHVLAFTYCDVPSRERRLPRSFTAIYVMGALGLSLLAIELVYPHIPEPFWLWNRI